MRPGGGRGRGVSALFAGDSGTGKTMSAEVIAADLGLDLYTVDLATVIDKYVGETEKNLERIFTEAAGVNGVLLLDEADAIFGKRSDVKDAHDRYANVESAFLPQRMESFDGLTILATNLRANLDDAFTRRLDLVVDFPLPDPGAGAGLSAPGSPMAFRRAALAVRCRVPCVAVPCRATYQLLSRQQPGLAVITLLHVDLGTCHDQLLQDFLEVLRTDPVLEADHRVQGGFEGVPVDRVHGSPPAIRRLQGEKQLPLLIVLFEFDQHSAVVVSHGGQTQRLRSIGHVPAGRL